jgi:hypothetical protein
MMQASFFSELSGLFPCSELVEVEHNSIQKGSTSSKKEEKWSRNGGFYDLSEIMDRMGQRRVQRDGLSRRQGTLAAG